MTAFCIGRQSLGVIRTMRWHCFVFLLYETCGEGRLAIGMFLTQ
jgi:hypothetical protein